jgi:alcohol dehydrogenase (cytochrome c)
LTLRVSLCHEYPAIYSKGETMARKGLFILIAFVLVVVTVSLSQVRPYSPVTEAMLQNPSPNDWLMFSRTYDAQRFSPLNQINKQNVGRLTQVWSKDMATGTQESIPLVHDGVMFVVSTGPKGSPAAPLLWALDATNGNLLWEYRRPSGGAINSKSFALYEDMVYYPAPDGYIVALDAKTGAVRWETLAVQQGSRLTAGLVVAGNKIISGRTCGGTPRQSSCYIAAHDAKTGKELWKFYTAAGPEDPVGDASWGGAPVADRSASTWGLAGSYDPVKKVIYWGVANPTPNSRNDRHGGKANAISMSAPADLYSNSTVAIDVETGKLKWYYQHLPGDDWDQDYTNERILLRTSVNPDPKAVKWINPTIPRNQQRDMAVSVGEGGGLFALDQNDGKFLWAMPFPVDTPRFLISRIDPDGKTWINEDLINDLPNERNVICSYNTKSYWPMSYHPGKNSLYIPYVDNCVDYTSANPAGTPQAPPVYEVKPSVCPGPADPAATAAAAAAPAAGGRGGPGGARGAAPAGRGGAATAAGTPYIKVAILRDGIDPNKFAGIAKVNMTTGEMTKIYEGCAPGNGATLATGGDVIFWGDLARRFRAFDADNGKILWETVLPGSIQNSTITYSVNGKQYVAVLTGRGGVTGQLLAQVGITPPPVNSNGLYVFALP